MPKILHVAPLTDSLRYLLASQLRWLAGHGYEVHAAAASGSHDAWVRESLGVPYHAVRIYRRVSPVRDLLTLVDLIRLLRRGEFDIVHTHTLKPMILAALAARVTGVPIIVNTLRPYFDASQSPLTRAAASTVDRLMIGMTDHLLAQNPDDIAAYVDGGLCPARKISVLGNGIDLGRFKRGSRTDAAAAELRRSIGAGGDAIVVGMVGRFVVEKGFPEFYEAIRRMRAANPQLRFLTAGGCSPDDRGALDDEIIRRNGLEDLGRHLGHRDDLSEVYRAMDILLFPSHREAFPRVLMEAAAMGLPIVATATRGARRCVRDGVNGFLVPVKDIDSMLRRVEQLAISTALREEMGRRSADHAAEAFDERMVFERIANCYGMLLARRGGAR